MPLQETHASPDEKHPASEYGASSDECALPSHEDTATDEDESFCGYTS